MIITPILLFLGVFVGTGYLVYCVGCMAYNKWVAKFYSTITIKNKDELFWWVQKYIIEKDIIKSSQSNLQGYVKHRENSWMGGDNVMAKPEMEWIGASGRDHVFYYKG